jgi:hypothetical protein
MADTQGLANAVYNQLSALYAGVQLPDFQSPSGNTVKCVVFVSGSSLGGYGAKPARPMVFVPLAQTVNYQNDLMKKVELRSHFMGGIMLTTNQPPGALEAVLTKVLAEVDRGLPSLFIGILLKLPICGLPEKYPPVIPTVIFVLALFLMRRQSRPSGRCAQSKTCGRTVNCVGTLSQAAASMFVNGKRLST